MKKIILLYGLSLAALTALLKFVEYRFLVRDLSIEIYISIIAIICTVIGIWLGIKLINAKKPHAVAVSSNLQMNGEAVKKIGISPREYEVLELIAYGHSNQEIADKLFVSLNTVKTHSTNLFSKLDVKRRTQAVQKAKDLNLFS
jgi:DNA-binding NarL/FixJ family response regulator